MDAIAHDGLIFDGLKVHDRIRASTSTELSAVRDSQVVLFCVKTVDTEVVAKALRPYLASDSVVIFLQNGVDNADRIYSSSRTEAIPAVVYVAAEMVAPGHVKHL